MTIKIKISAGLLKTAILGLLVFLCACDTPVQIHDTKTVESNITKQYTLNGFNSNLPIFIIDTHGKKIPGDPKRPARLMIAGVGDDNRAYVRNEEFEFDGRIGIERRGNSSSQFPKKQFSIEIWDDENEDRNASLLGLPKESDWVIHAPYSDKSLMRNHIAFWISNRIGMYAPRTKFVEMFLTTENDDSLKDFYWGVYLLIEKIKRDKDRVDIEKLTADQNDDDEISGGYILAQDWMDKEDGDCLGGTSPEGTAVCVQLYYPKNRNASEEQKEWIADYMHDFESALEGPDFTDPKDGYAKYINVDSFVDYLLLNELFRNNDGLRRSTFMHKPRNGKLTMGPYWDCNASMGNVNYHDSWLTEGWNLHTVPLHEPEAIPFWWYRLLEDDDFKEKLVSRWTEHRRSKLTVEAIDSKFDETIELLAEAQERNFKRWPIIGTYLEFNPEPIRDSWEQETEHLRNWLKDRIEWMDENIQDFNSEG